MLKKLKKQKGQSIVELLVAMGILTLILSGTIVLMMDTLESNRLVNERTKAVFLAQEGLEVARDIANRDFSEMTYGDHGTKNSFGYWEFDGTSDQFEDKYTRTINISDEFEENDDWYPPVSGGDYDLVGVSNPLDMIVANNRLYVVTAENTGSNPEFYIFNVATPEDPTLLGTLDLQATGNSIKYSSRYPDYVFIATSSDSAEMMVIDVSDPSFPILAGSYDAPGTSDGLEVFLRDDFAFLGTDNFYILDITSPVMPQLKSFLNGFDDLRGIYADANYAYLASTENNSELTIVDIIDPDAPSIYSDFNISGNPHGTGIFKIANHLFYSSTANSGSNPEFMVFDISDLADPQLVGELDIGADINDMFVTTKMAYLATDKIDREVILLNIYYPEAPYEFSHYDMADEANAIWKYNEKYVFVGTSFDDPEIELLDHGSVGWILPTHVSYYNTLGALEGQDVFTQDNYAYLTTSASGATPDFYVIDVSNLEEPSLVGDLKIGDSSAFPKKLVVEGDYAYVAVTGGTPEFQVVDIGSDPSDPTVIGSFEAGNEQGACLFIDGDRAYLGTANDSGNDPEFFILDISDPAYPSLIGSYDVGDDLNGIFVRGDYAYLATGHNTDEFLILNISDPEYPSEAGNFNISGNPEAEHIIISGNYAYLSTSDDGGVNPEFYIFDISNPASPTLRGELNLEATVYEMYLYQNLIYMATDKEDKELMVIELSDPTEPMVYGFYDANAVGRGIHLSADGQVVYLASDNNSRELIILASYDYGLKLEKRLVTSTVSWFFTPARPNSVVFKTILSDWQP